MVGLIQVRSRRKRKFCVACSLYVVDPTEAAAAAEKAAAEKAAAEHKTASAMLPVGGPPAVAPRLQPPSPASVSQPLPERGMAAAGGGGGGSDQLGRVTHDCIAALTHKLAQHTAVRRTRRLSDWLCALSSVEVSCRRTDSERRDNYGPRQRCVCYSRAHERTEQLIGLRARFSNAHLPFGSRACLCSRA